MLWPLEMGIWNSKPPALCGLVPTMLHQPNAGLARRGKLEKLFRYVEILIKTHELSTIHKYLRLISGMKVGKQEKKLQNEGKNYLATAN